MDALDRFAEQAPVPQQAAPTAAASKGEFRGVDSSAPTTTLQIRLADGHRLTGALFLGATACEEEEIIRLLCST